MYGKKFKLVHNENKSYIMTYAQRILYDKHKNILCL